MSTGWAWFIAIITTLSIASVCWLMLSNRRTASEGQYKPHVWDGDLTELNNPLPRWWLWLYFLTVIFAIAYLVLYPGIGVYSGALGWSQQSQHAAQVAAAERAQAPTFARYDKLSLVQLAHDAQAMATARNIFGNTCAACHGSDARGASGFPNLTDNDWLHGGSPDDVLETVTNGRVAMMPPFGAVLGDQGVDELVAYVRSISGHSDAPQELARAGAAKFQMYCFACHGADAKGNVQIGAPNLTDAIWLYGSSPAILHETIANGRQNAMPAHLPLLGPQRVRLMAAYVLSFSDKSAAALPAP
jgi:cytochrome c oxidase cbb3-type subunit 3